MPTSTYDLIASNVLGSSAASVTFSSIPATYRDLIIVINATAAVDFAIPAIRLNSDTGSNYSTVLMAGESGGPISQSLTSTRYFPNYRASTGAGTTRPLITLVHIMDYSATDKHKTFLSRGNTSEGVEAGAGRWANTAAVNTVQVLTADQNFATGSSFYLYGIVS